MVWVGKMFLLVCDLGEHALIPVLILRLFCHFVYLLGVFSSFLWITGRIKAHIYTIERVLFFGRCSKSELDRGLQKHFPHNLQKCFTQTTLSSLKKKKKTPSFFFFFSSRCIRALFFLHINSTDNPLLWRWKPLTEVEVDEAGWGKADTAKKVNYNTLSCNAPHISDWLMVFNCVKVTTRCISPLNRTT